MPPAARRDYSASTLLASTSSSERTSVLVRMPPAIKRALVREVARRGSNLNDVAVELLAERHGVQFSGSGRRRRVVPGAAARLPACRQSSARRPRRRARAGSERQRPRARNAGRFCWRSRSFRTERTPWLQPTAPPTAGREARTRCASPSSASGTAPTRSCRASTTTRTPTPISSSPASCTSTSASSRPRHRVHAAFDVTKDKVGKDGRRDLGAHLNDTYKFADVPKTGVKVFLAA